MTVDDPMDATRPRGILSESDRKYLLDPEGYMEDRTRQAANLREHEIPERIRHALADFVLLMERYPRQKRTEIFDAERPERPGSLTGLGRDLVFAIAFLYSGAEDAKNPYGRFFEKVLKVGVSSGEIDLGHIEDASEVHVDFDVERTSPGGLEKITELIENEEWDELEPIDMEIWMREMKDSSESFDPQKFLEEVEE